MLALPAQPSQPMAAPTESEADLKAKTKAILTQLRLQKHVQPGKQKVYVLAYGTGTLETPEKPTKKNPHPTPPPHEQHVLLRRITQGPRARHWYLWDLPQLPPQQMPKDVRDNAAVDGIVHPFMEITLAGAVPKPVTVPDEHLLQWWSAAAAHDGQEQAPSTMLVKYKVLSMEDLPMVRPEVAGVYRWWTVAEVRAGRRPGLLGDGDRECAVRLSDTGFWLERYPKMLEEVKREVEGDAAGLGSASLRKLGEKVV
ncbi:hypothetical protein LTR85_000839 [Meristemomyces frigidus]|nr:hypothetical protein LTR85_000839 [Meristemomyces frigidus]